MGRRYTWLLPIVFVTYSLAYLDRANFGFGAAAGMGETLGISEKQVSLLGSLFFLGYFLFQLPAAALARRVGVRRLITVLLMAWGVCAALTGVLRSFWLLCIVRVSLGAAESIIFPAMLLLLTNWFVRSERGRANGLLILGNPVTVLWMSLITGYLVQRFGWQRTFIVEGLPAVLWAGVWWIVVRDKPLQTPWMPRTAAESLEEVLAAEQASVPPVGSVFEALRRPDVILLCAQYFCWSLGIYGFVLWLPAIVREGASLSMGRTGILSGIPYLVAIGAMLAISTISDRTGRRESLVWPSLLLASLALFVSFLLAGKSFSLAFASMIVGGAAMYAPYGPFWAIIPERIPRAAVGEVMALINSAGALGGFSGSYLVGWTRAITGNSGAGFLLMAIALLCSSVLLLLMPRRNLAVANCSAVAMSVGAKASDERH
ncbi:MFS transporter [Edaphobacter aggregans]|uniref:MFS transporter n=1 Tax=Edaphobacter aggregans TaxID=570835 RepID=UPI001FE0E19A|nr:MFS transporter [Edaphobacter aggregans]